MKVKEESEKGDLKLNIQNEDHGIQSQSFTVNIRENNGNSEKLHFGGSEVTADGESGHEIKMCFLPRRKLMEVFFLLLSDVYVRSIPYLFTF